MTPIHYLLFLPPTFLAACYLGTKFGANFDIKNKSHRIKILFWIIVVMFFTVNVCLLTPLAVIFLYTCLLYLIYDLIVFILKKLKKKKIIKFLKRITMGGLTLLLISTSYTLYGVYKAKMPVITNYQINIKKNMNSNYLTVMLLSDLHLGTGSNCNTINEIVNEVNQSNADIFLIDGDLFDENTKEEYKTCAYQNLGSVNTKYGTYYVEGNHDLLTDDAREKFNDNNIITLEDEVVKINNDFYIIGRKDLKNERKTLAELMVNIDKTRPIILLDHRPVEEDIAENLGVDLQLAGHTHAGQLFPGNLFVQSGTKTIGNYHLIISSGYGTWGNAIRTSKSDEIVKIVIKKI